MFTIMRENSLFNHCPGRSLTFKGVKYSLLVIYRGYMVQCSIVSIHNQISFNSAPSDSPGELKVNHRLPTIAKLSWTPVPKDKQNGVITGYTVYVVGADSTSRREIPIEKGDATTVEISNLTPFTSYNFSISAKTRAGSGPVTTVSSRTPEDGEVALGLKL